MTDYDRVGQALKVYSDEMKRYTLAKLKGQYGEGRGWLEAYLSSFRSDERRENVVRTLQNSQKPEDTFDLNHVKDLLLAHRPLFQEDMKRTWSRAITYSEEISDVRNLWAHQQEIAPDDITRSLDSMSRVLAAVGADDAVKQLKSLRDNVPAVDPTKVKPVTLPAAAVSQPTPDLPSGNLAIWWQLAEPHVDIRKGNFDENTFAAKLDDVVDGKAPPEYLYADEFYTKTYLTGELKGLLRDTLKRLSATGGEAVVQLRTPFGGGKTHALIALYHLVKKAADIEAMPDIQGLLADAGLVRVPHARTAVIVGTAIDPQGRTAEDGTQIQTLWGELAYQIGGKDAYAFVKKSDQARTSPGKETLRRLLEKYAKALVLLDEVLVYQVKAAGVQVGETTLQAQTFAFLQELTEVVASVPGTALVTTFPESNTEYYDSAQAEPVFDRLEKIFGRVQAVRIPVQGEEIFEVVRRRLFSKIDENAARRVLAEYRKVYEEHRDDLPSDVRSGDYAARMGRAYPFHPELITVLYERWGTMQGFQKTRGVLRLLARVIEYGYNSSAARPLIGVGDVGLEDADLRATMTQLLRNSSWEAVVASDIAPGKATTLDKEIGNEYSKHRLCLTTTSAIFMYSHSGGAERGVQEPRLRLALLQPEGITPALISDALARMKNALYYLYGNGGWSFRVQPNLNAVLTDRMGQVRPEKIEERVEQALLAKTGTGLFKAYVWPNDHREVPDDAKLKAVLLKPSQSTDDAEENERIRNVIQMNAAGSPRLHKNTLVYLSGRRTDFARAFDKAREVVALEDVKSDRDLALSSDQKNDLNERLSRSTGQLPELAKACYSALYEPYGAKDEFRVHDLSAAVKTQPNVLSAVTETLQDQDRLLSGLDPALLVRFEPYKLWPSDVDTVNLKNLREYLERYPHLPMLETMDVLKRSVIQGVRNSVFEAALKAGDAYTQVWRRENPPSENDLFFQAHYQLTRVGVVPRPEKVIDKVEPPLSDPRRDDDGVPPVKPPPDVSPKVKRRVQLRFANLPVEQIDQLVDVAGALQDAGGALHISVSIEATNPDGLDETALELNVREVLSQYGLTADWEES